MRPVILNYRNKELTHDDILYIQEIIENHYTKGRTQISQILCKVWGWYQPNGKLKGLAARDLLLYLEEKNLVKLPPQKRNNNNHKKKSFDQIPVFINRQLDRSIAGFPNPVIQLEDAGDSYL
jgi:hypothetical protein